MKRNAMLALVLIPVFAVSLLTFQHAFAAENITWKLQSPFPAGLAVNFGATYFAKMVTESSGGRLTVKFFPGGSIVPPLKEFDAVKSGTLDAHFSSSLYHTSQVGLAGDLFALYPGGFSATEFATWCYEGGGLALWQELYDRKGYPVVALGTAGLYSAELFGWFKKPIKTLNDFKGMKFRTSGMWGEILTELGAAVVMLPGGEIFESMKRGVLDAFEFSTPGNDYSAGFHQLGDYMIGPGIHAPGSAFELLVNKNSWEKLSPDLQALVKVAASASSFRMLNALDYSDVVAMEKMKAYGVKAFELPQDVQKEVVKVANALYDRKAKEDPFFAKVLNHQRNFLKEYRAYKNFTQPNPNLMQSESK